MGNASLALGSIPLEERSEVLLDRALELSAMSGSVQELLRLTRRDDAEIGPVVDALSKNPSLTAAVLRAANSPAYGQSRSVADLSRAVLVLGMQELHDLVASTAMMAAFSRADPLSERMQASAPLSASIAQKLTARLGGVPSTAYLSGLMCELGALACIALDPGYAELHQAAQDDPAKRFADEKARYGRTTAAIGGRILAASDLPAQVTEAVATTGIDGAQTSELGRVVAFARLAAFALKAATEHGEPEQLWAALHRGARLVGLKADDELLVHVCLAAASQAELTLGPKFVPEKGAANDVGGQKRMTDRVQAGSSKAPLYAGIAAAVVVAGALVWFLLG